MARHFPPDWCGVDVPPDGAGVGVIVMGGLLPPPAGIFMSGMDMLAAPLLLLRSSIFCFNAAAVILGWSASLNPFSLSASVVALMLRYVVSSLRCVASAVFMSSSVYGVL